jgi:hypothetical protein
MPERVAPVTCEYIEAARARLKAMTIKVTKIFVSFRGPIACTLYLLNDRILTVE